MAQARLILGYSCNNNCRMCNVADDREKRHAQNILLDIPTDINKRKLQFLRENGYDSIVLTGGEPTLRDDFFELLDSAHELGFRVTVETNGRAFYYDHFAKQVAERKIAEFHVALQGPTEAVHDAITEVSRSFLHTTTGIKHLLEQKQTVVLRTAIVKQNVEHLSSLLEACVQLGIKKALFSICQPKGAAWEHAEDVMVRYSDVDAKALLSKADSLGVELLFEGFPICHMDTFKALYEFSDISSRDSRLPLKEKFEQCRECSYASQCEGVWKGYSAKFGNDEFQPLKFKIDTKVSELFTLSMDDAERVEGGYILHDAEKKYFVKAYQRTNFTEEKSRNLSSFFDYLQENGFSTIYPLKTPENLRFFEYLHGYYSLFDFKDISSNVTLHQAVNLLTTYHNVAMKYHGSFGNFYKRLEGQIAFIKEVLSNDKNYALSKNSEIIKFSLRKAEELLEAKNKVVNLIIHDDPHLSNFSTVSGKVFLLDFENNQFGPRIYDLAVLLHSVGVDKKNELLQQYSNYVEKPLTADEKELIEAALYYYPLQQIQARLQNQMDQRERHEEILLFIDKLKSLAVSHKTI